MKTIEAAILSNGVSIPKLGLGTYKTSGEEVRNAVKAALAHGYTSIDTARFYENERDVAEAIESSGKSRNELFITSKLWNTDHGYDNAMRSFEDSLKDLKTDYLDLYLIHWPGRDRYVETWKAFETLYREQRVRAIGVSNFLKHHLETLLEHCDVLPMVDQIETHAYYMDMDTIGLCKSRGIMVEAWAPLARGGALLEDPLLTAIAKKHGKTPAQTALRFLLQNDIIVIPKSVHENRIRQNMDVFDFILSKEDNASDPRAEQKRAHFQRSRQGAFLKAVSIMDMIKNVKIKLARETDCAGILAVYAPYVLNSEFSFETEVPSEPEMKSRMEKIQAFFPWLVLETDGKIAGYAYASKHRERGAYMRSCDCSVYVHPEYHGKRIGTALYTCLFDILRLQGFYSVFAGVSLPNEKSCALHESMGFYPVGVYQNAGYKSGRWIDTKWYGLKLLKPVPFPEKPKPVGEISPDKLTALFRKAERIVIL